MSNEHTPNLLFPIHGWPLNKNLPSWPVVLTTLRTRVSSQRKSIIVPTESFRVVLPLLSLKLPISEHDLPPASVLCSRPCWKV